MSVIDVKRYYNEVCEQRHQLLEELNDFSKEAENNLIEPERLEQIKQNIQPLLNNYQMLSYIMFLLNKPVKKSKHKRYEQQNKRFLATIDKQYTKDGVIATNEEILSSLKK